jgi:hypothetical protein
MLYARQLRLSQLCTVLLVAVATSACTSPDVSPVRAEVWLCPFPPELVDSPGEWKFVANRVSGVQLYVDWINKTPAETLARAAKFVRERNIQVSVECGGTVNADWQDQAGERAAAVELAKIAKWTKAGGVVDYLNLDGPVCRLLGHGGWNRGAPFTSIERCADELMDYMSAVKRAHPKIRFFLLTNFPNWGYRGDVSYHARGPARQDNGDYDEVLRIVLRKAKQAGHEFTGITVDNPYEYTIGELKSARLAEPSKVDWLARIRSLEDFARSRGLEFGLIINSEKGGKTSDRAFFERTLKMLDMYIEAGGKPTRYFVQSWYRFPERYLPEDAPHSMTSLLKTVMRRLHSGLRQQERAR